MADNVNSWETLWNSLKTSAPKDTSMAWLSQVASPLAPISTAYKENINESLQNLNTVLPQYSQMIQGMAPTYNSLLGSAQDKANPIYNTLSNQYGNLSNIFGGATSELNLQKPQIYNTLNSVIGDLQGLPSTAMGSFYGTQPIYGQSINDINSIYQNIMGNIGSQQQGTSALDEVWKQYNDTYSKLANAQNVTQTGELAPATQGWIDKLGGSMRTTMDTQLSDVYNRDIKGMLANLSERGILNSDQANRSFAQVGDKYLTQKRIGESQIAELMAKAGLELPFNQYESALKSLQAPQIGGTLADLYGSIMSKMSPMYEMALKSAQAPSDVSSDYLGKLAESIMAQINAGNTLTDTASNLMKPATTSGDMATALSNAMGMYGQTQYGGTSSMTNALASMLTGGYDQQQTGMANLLEQYTNQPNQLMGTALEQYGGIGSLIAKLLSDQYIAEQNIAGQTNIANNAADASADTALWGALGGLLGNVFKW